MGGSKTSMLCAAGMALVLAAPSLAQNGPSRVSATQKGSLLIFSKVELRWTADGQSLLQDTVLEISNDYPEDIDIQAFFINGDEEVKEVCAGFPCDQNIIQEAEPGWNTADCRFSLTANQPHAWSAATGSEKCQPFTVLDASGPGRPDPETGMTTRILRGYVVMFAVDYFAEVGAYGQWQEIRWNHLMGSGTVINYQDGTAWSYNPWGFQAHGVDHAAPLGDAGILNLDGLEYEAPFGNLILDFYATGSTALSSTGEVVQVDTDLTVHAVSADLRQDGCGPVLTKVVVDVWNEFESKFSGTRRCVCCWDQTMLSDWVRTSAVPNHFMRSTLGTDKGKARLDAVASVECDYEVHCGAAAMTKRSACSRMPEYDPPLVAGVLDESEDTAILGLAIKLLEFTPSDDRDMAALNLAGAGTEPAYIEYDVQEGPAEAFGEFGRESGRRFKDPSDGRPEASGVRGAPSGRELPAE